MIVSVEEVGRSMKLALSVTDVLNDSGNEFFPKGVAIENSDRPL